MFSNQVDSLSRVATGSLASLLPAKKRRAIRASVRQSTRNLLQALEDRALLTATLSTVYNFKGTTDGRNPVAIAVDKAGNVYGASFTGGTNGRGNVWEIPAGKSTPVVLHSFSGTESVGAAPSLVVDASGNVFGITPAGGTSSNGSIFEISAGSHAFKTIHSFAVADGNNVSPTISVDSHGNLWGTTKSGGANGAGFLFKVAAGSHTFTDVHDFTSGEGAPVAAVADASGNVFGATSNGLFEIASGSTTFTSIGGVSGVTGLNVLANGTVLGTTGSSIFSVSGSTPTATTLFTFSGGNGAQVNPLLAVDSAGNIFGTTLSGGASNQGTLFELSNGNLTTITSFNGTNGNTPEYGAVITPKGDVFGVNFGGGTGGFGTVFKFGTGSSNGSGTPAGAARSLVFATKPTKSVIAGTSLNTLTINIVDSHGHIVTTDNSNITLTLVGKANGTLDGNVTVAAVNGVATFSNLSITKAGAYTITATDNDETLKVGKSAGFTIIPDVSTEHLLFTGSTPTTAVVGKSIGNVTVTAVDQFNNVVTSDHSKVHLAISTNPANGTLTGVSNVSLSNGVARFRNNTITVSNEDAGSPYSIQASDAALAANSNNSTYTPIAFNMDVTKGNTTLAAPHTAHATFNSNATITDQLRTTAGPTVPFTGTVTLIDTANSNATLATGTVSSKGLIKFTFNDIAPGSYTGAAIAYSGDVNQNAVTSPTFTLTVAQASSTSVVHAASASIGSGSDATLNVTVTGKGNGGTKPSGTVNVMEGGVQVGTGTLDGNGQAVITITAPAVGTHRYAVVYAGDSNFNTSTSSTISVKVLTVSIG